MIGRLLCCTCFGPYGGRKIRELSTIVKAWTKQLKFFLISFLGIGLDCILGPVLCHFQTLWIGQALYRAWLLVFVSSCLFLVFCLLCTRHLFLLFLFNTIPFYLLKRKKKTQPSVWFPRKQSNKRKQFFLASFASKKKKKREKATRHCECYCIPNVGDNFTIQNLNCFFIFSLYPN